MQIKSHIISNNNFSNNNLPLSWTLDLNATGVSAIKLSRKCLWLNGGSFGNVDNFISTVKDHSKKKRIIIRGCNKSVTELLKKEGYSETLFAKEAIIELDKKIELPEKLQRRINSLLNRGRVKEISFTEKNILLFNELLTKTIHWDKPQLQHLFQDRMTENTRLFVFEIIPDKWEGAILISKNSETKMQGEQFFRKKDGMNGIMDALVWKISTILMEERFSEFSLGEVPFVAKDKRHLFSKTNMLQFIGSKFRFAYNYNGLFHFKNKFATRWDDVFICSNSKLKFLDLFRIARKSNLLALTVYKMFN